MPPSASVAASARSPPIIGPSAKDACRSGPGLFCSAIRIASSCPQCYEAGLISGTGDDMLMVGADQVLPRWLGRRPDGLDVQALSWRDDTTTGVQMMSDDAINDLVMDAHAKGYQLACHAIGDAAIEQLITAYENALAAIPIRTGGIGSSIAASRRQRSMSA